VGRFGFVGPSYTSQSSNADAERCANWYPETIEAQGKSILAMYPTPGLTSLQTLPGNQPVDALIWAPQPNSATGNFFAISGTSFYQLDTSSGARTLKGTFASNILHSCFMTYGSNGTTTAILMCVDEAAYYYIVGTPNMIPVSIGGGALISQVGYIDGFFLAVQAFSNQIYASAPLDVTTWPALSTTKISVFPDQILAMVVNQRQVTFFGASASVSYYDSGNSPFPLDVIDGSYMEHGIINASVASATAVKIDNSIIWLGNDARGQGVVWRANGYTPVRISNHAVEYSLQQIASQATINDAVAYSYQDQGHEFYVLYLPSANSGRGFTWVYDVATAMWHERFFLNPVDGLAYAHRSKCHAQFAGLHIVGDWQLTGKVYRMQIPQLSGTSWLWATDFNNPIQRIRRSPHINLEKEWIFHSQLEVDLEAGLGPIPPITGASNSPSVVYLTDANGVIWSVTITDPGVITRTSGGAGPGQLIVINDSTANTISWQLGITIGGVLTTTSISYQNVFPQTLQMATSGSLKQSGLQVNGAGVVSSVAPFSAAKGPDASLRWSNDGGHIWTNYLTVGVGQQGDFNKRAIWRRLGRARQRIYEFSVSDPVPWRIVDAYLKASPDFAPEERLVKRLAKSA
jgi:hypothetical protein